MSDIHRLVYVSAARDDMTPAKLDEILTVARRNNLAVKVTGLLLFHDGSFFQVLEGQPAMVEAIFSAIERDTRHSRILVMQKKTSNERCFPDWSMGYVRPQDMQSDQQQSLVDLRRMIGGGQREALTALPAVSVLIDSFLSTFREFAEV